MSRWPSPRSTTHRSTTFVATERGNRGIWSVLVAAVLVLELVAASFVIGLGGRGESHTVRLINLGGARSEVLLARVGADMAGAVAAVDGFWGSDWPREIVVVATGSAAQFTAEAHLDPDRQWSDIAAVAVADDVDLADRRAVGQRIVLAPGAADMTDQALRIVMTHELFHFATRADTALDAPRWLTEGVADFVARPPAPLPPGAAAVTTLPTDAALDVPGPDRSTGYDRAWWFARFIADRYGADGLRRLYQDACGPGHGTFATAVRGALGVESSVLQTQWARWLTG